MFQLGNSNHLSALRSTEGKTDQIIAPKCKLKELTYAKGVVCQVIKILVP